MRSRLKISCPGTESFIYPEETEIAFLSETSMNCFTEMKEAWKSLGRKNTSGIELIYENREEIMVEVNY